MRTESQTGAHTTQQGSTKRKKNDTPSSEEARSKQGTKTGKMTPAREPAEEDLPQEAGRKTWMMPQAMHTIYVRNTAAGPPQAEPQPKPTPAKATSQHTRYIGKTIRQESKISTSQARACPRALRRNGQGDRRQADDSAHGAPSSSQPPAERGKDTQNVRSTQNGRAAKGPREHKMSEPDTMAESPEPRGQQCAQQGEKPAWHGNVTHEKVRKGGEAQS